MSKTTRQNVFLIAKIISGLIVLLAISVFVFRNALLQKAIVHISHKMETDYNSHFSIQNAKLSAWVIGSRNYAMRRCLRPTT